MSISSPNGTIQRIVADWIQPGEVGTSETNEPRGPQDLTRNLQNRPNASQNPQSDVRFAQTPRRSPHNGLTAGNLVAQANVQKASQPAPVAKVPPKEVKESEFKRNWHLGAGYTELKLNQLTNKQQSTLSKADANGDGLLTKDEAWKYVDEKLDTSGKVGDGKATVVPTGTSKEFEQTLSKLFTERSGRVVNGFEHTDVKGDVLYMQFNRNNGKTREEKDVKKYVKADKDKPELTRKDLTADLNSWKSKAEGKAAFKAEMREYIKGLKKDGKSMTGFILSGHSNGRDMLQETADHDYIKKLDVREALMELRQEDPEIAKYFDQCEYVALQACFQGQAYGEWDQVFPNATIAGTEKFGPLAKSKSSGKMLQAAIKGHTAVEYGGSVEDANKAAKPSINKDLRNRGFLVEVPAQRLERSLDKRTKARDNFNKHQTQLEAFAKAANEVSATNPADWDTFIQELHTKLDKEGWDSKDFKKLYEATNLRTLSERSTVALEGNDPNNFQVDFFGTDIPIGRLEAYSNALFDLRFEH